ncbi:MAG TPA: M28 family metallopeptidase [Pyrinomonadaceae bacterium]|nr:M28 family metallopeptidase [Pyrinomonadaceae bacterium]
MKKWPDNRSSAAGAKGAALTLLLLTLPLLFTACTGGGPQPNAPTPTTPTASPARPPAAAGLKIDGDRAFEHVRKQVEFGPRPAGSSELARTREYIVSELRSYGLEATVDEWQAATPIGPRKMANVVAELPGESTDVIILSSHYDTKLIKEFRFVGANDGGSSTGALLEMARVMKAAPQKPRLTYRFVFFDGEEAFCQEWSECTTPEGPDNTYGSRHYVKQLKASGELKRVRAMILLDMIGYKELELGRNDMLSTRWLIDAVWDTARELGYDKYFVDAHEGCDGDDHVPFLQEGVQALDIIQLETYIHWHTAEDTLDKISPQSLKIVADTVLASLPRIEERVLRQQPAP